MARVDDVYSQVSCNDDRVLKKIAEHYTFEVPGAKYDRRVRRGFWDGKVSLFDPELGLLYCGLWEDLRDFCSDKGYEFRCDIRPRTVDYGDFLDRLGGGKEARDYQRECFERAVSYGRRLILSPTGSGKSLSIYHLIEYYNEPTLVIVPRVGLVKQLTADFLEYGLDPESIGGRDDGKQVVVCTYQSIYKHPARWFEKFRLVIGDECLHPDSLITMADKTRKKISDINVGDKVLSYNELTRTIETDEVVKLHRNLSIDEEMYEITIESGECLKLTGNHQVLLSTGEWVRTDQLKEGDEINSYNITGFGDDL